MPKQHRTVICRDGWCYLLLVATVFAWAILREANLLLIVAGMLTGPVLLSWRLASATVRRLDVRRRAPRAVHAGELLTVDVEVHNARKRLGTWALVVEDRLRRESDAKRSRSASAEVLFCYVPPGATRRLSYRSRPPQRGRYLLGPLTVSTRFPFGLFRRSVAFESSETFTVLPRLGRLTAAWSLRTAEVFEGPERGRRPTREPGEFFGVREWQSGDSTRWIHWRSTARHGTLVARQFERPGGRDVAVLVDLWQPGEPGNEDLENVELAVSFAATVVADLCRKGGVRLWMGVAGAEPASISGPASIRLMEEALEKLAVAEASSEDRLPALFERAGSRIKPHTEVLLVGTRARSVGEIAGDGALPTDPHCSASASRIRVIHPANPDFPRYFQVK
jgi:uncharacterized protein (DUF58 family)